VTVSVEEEMLKLQAVERVSQNYTQSIITEVQPAQGDEVGERTDLERLETTLAEVEMFELDERRQVDPSHHRPVERVAVEVELETVDGDAGRDGGETAARAVHNAAW